MKKRKVYMVNILIFAIATFYITACGETTQNMALTINTGLVEKTNRNYDIIYNSYISCKDYEWLSQRGFSPCRTINQKIDKYMDVKRIWDFKFEKCNIWGNKNSDIIMKVNVENTHNKQFVLLIVFINADNKYYAVKSISLTSRKISYKLIDINGDSKSEILFDYFLLANGTYKHLEIYQCQKKTSMKCIFNKHIDTNSYSMSYRFINETFPKLLIKKNKTYFNTNDKKRLQRKNNLYMDIIKASID